MQGLRPYRPQPHINRKFVDTRYPTFSVFIDRRTSCRGIALFCTMPCHDPSALRQKHDNHIIRTSPQTYASSPGPFSKHFSEAADQPRCDLLNDLQPGDHRILYTRLLAVSLCCLPDPPNTHTLTHTGHRTTCLSSAFCSPCRR